jgi:site-specific DNA-methyltransferase (adenine-specific)
MLETNKIYVGNHLNILSLIDDRSIDLTITSPPYDNLRAYDGFDFDFESLAQELYRVTKDGGVVVWIVSDATIDGSETGTSFMQALYFKEIGFNLLDIMIYKIPGTGAKGSNNCYWQTFEYMFVLTKGRIKTVNRIRDRQNKSFNTKRISSPKQKDLGTRLCPSNGITIQRYGIRDNVWVVPSGFGHGDATSHPAVFPEQLANDHILSWSNEGDLVLDPMCGAGTTCKMARLNNRDYIGIDISSKYCEMARKRLAKIPIRLDKFF